MGRVNCQLGGEQWVEDKMFEVVYVIHILSRYRCLGYAPLYSAILFHEMVNLSPFLLRVKMCI